MPGLDRGRAGSDGGDGRELGATDASVHRGVRWSKVVVDSTGVVFVVVTCMDVDGIDGGRSVVRVGETNAVTHDAAGKRVGSGVH